jgi:hypothetical protein
MIHLPLFLALVVGGAQPASIADGGKVQEPAVTPSAFPPGTFDDFRTKWYSKHLLAASETVLDAKGPEVYRFTWLRTFHAPVVIRIRADPDYVRLVVKVLSGAGGYDPGTVAMNRTYLIPQETWKSLTTKLDQVGFWAMPTNKENRGFDGAQWILEGARAGRYHAVDRWSASSDDKPFASLCLALMELAHLDIPSGDLY